MYINLQRLKFTSACLEEYGRPAQLLKFTSACLEESGRPAQRLKSLLVLVLRDLPPAQNPVCLGGEGGGTPH